MIASGQLVHGLAHPELGHLRIPHDPAADPFAGVCPYHGDCFEGLASGPAIAARWGKPAEELTGDERVWELEARYIALGLVALVAVISPELIVLGGGVGTAPELLGRVESAIGELLRGYVGRRRSSRRASAPGQAWSARSRRQPSSPNPQLVDPAEARETIAAPRVPSGDPFLTGGDYPEGVGLRTRRYRERTACRTPWTGAGLAWLPRARARPRAPLRQPSTSGSCSGTSSSPGCPSPRARRLRPVPPRDAACTAPACAGALAPLPAERAVHRHRLRPPVGRAHAAALVRRSRALRVRLDGHAARLRLALPRARGRPAPLRRASPAGPACSACSRSSAPASSSAG